MAIKPQKFIIDEAVLDLIGNEFKFDHAKGLSEWMKNSCDAYLREGIADDKQYIALRLVEGKHGYLKQIECIDFVGMDKFQIDEAFKRFFDPQAAKKGAKEANIKTLGGHGNGGKFYMRQMFSTSQLISYRNGKLNIFGFNEKKQYGYEDKYENRPMSLTEAMRKANICDLEIPDHIKHGLESEEYGFTLVRGEHPSKMRGTSNRNNLIEKLVYHPQARRLIERKYINLIINNETRPTRLVSPKIVPKEGYEQPIIHQIPEELEFDNKKVSFKNDKYDWTGRLILKTSNDPLRANLGSLNTIDFIGEVGVIASYKIYELGANRYSSQTEFIYGECECPILEDPENDCVRNDRQKLIENERSQALLVWVQKRVDELAEKMELKNAQEKKKQDLKNTSVFNELLNRWKNRFMSQVWAEVFMGKGPAGSDGEGPGENKASGGKGKAGDGGQSNRAGHEGGSDVKRKPRFPIVMISGIDADPLSPLATTPFNCDTRHPAVYRRTKDVEAGIYWINTSRPLAEKIIKSYTSDSPRWREYLFQRYIDIILKEAIYKLGEEKIDLRPEDIDAKIDDITTRIHDQAAIDLESFLFEEKLK